MCGVQCLVFDVPGLGFEVWSLRLEFGVWGLGLRVYLVLHLERELPLRDRVLEDSPFVREADGLELVAPCDPKSFNQHQS